MTKIINGHRMRLETIAVDGKPVLSAVCETCNMDLSVYLEPKFKREIEQNLKREMDKHARVSR